MSNVLKGKNKMGFGGFSKGFRDPMRPAHRPGPPGSVPFGLAVWLTVRGLSKKPRNTVAAGLANHPLRVIRVTCCPYLTHIYVSGLEAVERLHGRPACTILLVFRQYSRRQPLTCHVGRPRIRPRYRPHTGLQYCTTNPSAPHLQSPSGRRIWAEE